MDNYYLNFPSDADVMRLLQKAGADENTQIAGTLWLKDLVAIIAKSKHDKEDQGRVSELHTLIKRARRMASRILLSDPVVHRDISDTTKQYCGSEFDRALEAMDIACSGLRHWRSGSTMEAKHQAVIEGVFRFLDSEKLNVNFSIDSASVALISAFTGASRDSVTRQVSRLREGTKEGKKPT